MIYEFSYARFYFIMKYTPSIYKYMFQFDLCTIHITYFVHIFFTNTSSGPI